LDIMVPYWGSPDLLRATVRSVLAQTDPAWRLVVVDDAYPDPAAGEWVQAIDDERVSYVRHGSNVGITENYRACLRLATAEHVVLLGCDDLLHPRYVEVVRRALADHPDVDMVQPGVQVVDEAGTPVRTLVDVVKQRFMTPRGRRVLSGEALATSLLRADWLYWPSLVLRREASVRAGFRSGFPIIQDLAHVLDVVQDGGNLLVVPEVCFSYRRHRRSASSTTLVDGSRFRGERQYFELAAEQCEALGWRRAARAARWHSTSRAHALALLPGALVRRDRAAVGALWHHLTARSRGHLTDDLRAATSAREGH